RRRPAGGGRDAAGARPSRAPRSPVAVLEGKDEVADMKCGMRNAECGMRSAEWTARASTHGTSLTPGTSPFNSAFRTPHSPFAFDITIFDHLSTGILWPPTPS